MSPNAERMTESEHEAMERALELARALTGNYNPSRKIIEAIRNQLPRPATPDFPYAAQANELIDMLRRHTALKEERPRAREIGQQLNAAGGFSAMHAVAMEIRRQFPDGEGGYEDGWHPSEIDHAWHGIGLWKA